MTLRRITAPTALPVTLAEAKLHLRVDAADMDTLIAGMIGSAVEAAEHITGRVLMAQTWEIAEDEFPRLSYQLLEQRLASYVDDAFRLTRVPVQSVTSITYTDGAGVVQTLASNQYQVSLDDVGFARIFPAYGLSWPANRGGFDSIKVRYVAGYTDAASVPQAIKSWILLQVGAMYENRESEVVDRGAAITLGFADRLLDRYQVYG